jgi:hypothetical protein
MKTPIHADKKFLACFIRVHLCLSVVVFLASVVDFLASSSRNPLQVPKNALPWPDQNHGECAAGGQPLAVLPVTDRRQRRPGGILPA